MFFPTSNRCGLADRPDLVTDTTIAEQPFWFWVRKDSTVSICNLLKWSNCFNQSFDNILILYSKNYRVWNLIQDVLHKQFGLGSVSEFGTHLLWLLQWAYLKVGSVWLIRRCTRTQVYKQSTIRLHNTKVHTVPYSLTCHRTYETYNWQVLWRWIYNESQITDTSFGSGKIKEKRKKFWNILIICFANNIFIQPKTYEFVYIYILVFRFRVWQFRVYENFL